MANLKDADLRAANLEVAVFHLQKLMINPLCTTEEILYAS